MKNPFKLVGKGLAAAGRGIRFGAYCVGWRINKIYNGIRGNTTPEDEAEDEAALKKAKKDKGKKPTARKGNQPKKPISLVPSLVPVAAKPAKPVRVRVRTKAAKPAAALS